MLAQPMWQLPRFGAVFNDRKRTYNDSIESSVLVVHNIWFDFPNNFLPMRRGITDLLAMPKEICNASLENRQTDYYRGIDAF